MKPAIAERFARAAATYDAHSTVQRHAAKHLAALIMRHAPQAGRVLEIGCGTGHLTQELERRLPSARLFVSDIAPAMVAACRARHPQHAYLVMDGEQPAVRGPFGLVCANLAAQWFVDLPASLTRLAGLLAPGGILAMSLLAEETFHEWRKAHAAVGLAAGARRFPSVASLAGAFPVQGRLMLAEERRMERFPTAIAFLRALRALGADAPAPGHRPLTPGQLRRVLRVFADEPVASYALVYALWRKA